METVTVISHLTPEEWKLSWEDKVVEDTRENMRRYQQHSCYWGHFSNDQDFTICHHKEFEVKSMSLGLYFNGHLEADEKGSRITGRFGKKLSVNLFLAMGAVLCLVAFFGAAVKADLEVMLVSLLLFAILFLCYLAKPKKGQKRILQQLEQISFDETFHNRRRVVKEPKRKRTMREKAQVPVYERESDDAQKGAGAGV